MPPASRSRDHLSDSEKTKFLALYNSRHAEATRPASDAVVHSPPSLLEKAGNFASSLVKHVAAGAPRCTEEEVAARHAICVGCEYFANNTCTKCGCPLSRERTYLGKLSWANQSCPVGKWGPVERPENKG